MPTRDDKQVAREDIVLVQRGPVERDDEVVGVDEAAGNVDGAVDLGTDQAIGRRRGGHERIVARAQSLRPRSATRRYMARTPFR
jgi:hypothetical protein